MGNVDKEEKGWRKKRDREKERNEENVFRYEHASDR